MKKILFKLLLFVPLFLTIIIINYTVDPAHIFDEDEYVEWLAKTLLDNKQIRGIKNYDDRLLQKYYIKNLEKKLSIALIGSSRSMQVNSNDFSDTFFNNSVSGTTIQDYIAIIGLYVKYNKLPKKIILGLDPWLLNRNNAHSGIDRWKSLIKYYNYMANKLEFNNEKEIITAKYYKYKELVSLSYFQESLKNFFLKEDELKGNIKHSDGSITYSSEYAKRDYETVKREILVLLEKGNIAYFNNFIELDNKYSKILEILIRFLKKKNIEIEFFFAPYHPLIFHSKQKFVNKLIETEKYYRELANKFNIKVLGSYNPDKYNCKVDEFYDYMHPKRTVIKKILYKSKL